MNDIIVAVISGGCAILANQVLTHRTLSENDLKHAKLTQSFEDRITTLEGLVKERQDHDAEMLEKLNQIEKTVIIMQKDLQYLKDKGV